jgi:hypothetical protein
MEKLIYLHYIQYQYCILKKNLLGGIFVFLVSYICIYVYNINPVYILKGNFVSQTIQFMSTVVINFDTWSVQTIDIPHLILKYSLRHTWRFQRWVGGLS